MENWKIQFVIVTFCVLAQTCKGSSSSSKDEGNLSNDWQYESVDRGATGHVDGLMKRSKALRFYGLMGKRAVTRKPFQVKRRNKGGAFVGLMGRSVSSKEFLSGVIPSATAREIRDPKKPYKQGMTGAVGKNLRFSKGLDTHVLTRHFGKRKHLYNVYTNQRL